MPKFLQKLDDELLGVVNEEVEMEIEISKIHAFQNHPFKVLDDEKWQFWRK